jgi:hypothetical protein
LGVSEAAVSQWMRRAREGGPEALRHRPSPGAPRRLSADHLARLPALLHRGAEAYGFRGAGVDLGPNRRGAAPGVGRLRSSRPCGPLAESTALEPATTTQGASP